VTTPTNLPLPQGEGENSAVTISRCAWAAGADAAMRDYHDREWGVPHHNDSALFELLTLEGAQAGLSWRTILARRDEYRRAYHRFDIKRIAGMRDPSLEKLLTSSGIIRNRLKVWSVRDNARTALDVIAEHGSLDAYLWSFVGGRPLMNRWQESKQVPATTALSDQMSKALAKRGFRFVGSTICYAFMQATGMVNDHLVSCFRYEESGHAEH
jgi:DNA-3-methyladenine glycosylase I